MDVRPADSADIALLATIWFDGWQDAHARLVPQELARTRTLESFAARIEADLANTRVAGPEGAPVGFCIVKGDELYQLYVSAQARGSGVAADLLSDGEKRIGAGGARVAWLACTIGNERAARFYEKSGWRRVATVVYQAETTEGMFPLEVWRYEKAL